MITIVMIHNRRITKKDNTYEQTNEIMCGAPGLTEWSNLPKRYQIEDKYLIWYIPYQFQFEYHIHQHEHYHLFGLIILIILIMLLSYQHLLKQIMTYTQRLIDHASHGVNANVITVRTQ